MVWCGLVVWWLSGVVAWWCGGLVVAFAPANSISSKRFSCCCVVAAAFAAVAVVDGTMEWGRGGARRLCTFVD